MTPDRWKRVEEVYSTAVDLPLPERLAYVSEACGEDEALRSEVHRLMEADSLSDGFLERPLSMMEALIPIAAPTEPRLRPGEVLCDRFEVIRFLARGGMGEVYEAYDTLLREQAALKIIRPELASNPVAIEQFKQEVSRARSVRSDHVCQIFELFQHTTADDVVVFLTMQLLQGETIAERIRRRGPFRPAEALPLLKQIAEGLDAAHGHQERIIHGDLKSGNVMLLRTHDGGLAASITDFGLARKASPETSAAEQPAEPAAGHGTAGWLSPERRAGACPSQASDIYALGLLAFQMITGEMPSGPQPLARLNGNWRRAVARCLEEDPRRRCPSGGAFIRLLEGGATPILMKRSSLLAVSAAAVVVVVLAAWYMRSSPARGEAPIEETSMAVLPIVSPSTGADAEYFADALTEELSLTAAKIRGLRVIGPESAFRFKGSRLEPREIARQLRVRYLLSGSVRGSGDGARILVRLTRLPEGFQAWAQEYDRDGPGVSSVKYDIVRQVAKTMDLSLAGFGPGGGASSDMKAQDLYWKGRYYWRLRTEAGLRRSVEYFEMAVAIDPSFALGWTGVADAYAAIAERSIVPPTEALSRAHRAASTALSLDRGLPDAWVSRGQVVSLYDRDFDEAERSFQQALALNPRLTTAHQWYSYLLVKQRRFPEALREAQAALDADPLSLPGNINMAVLLYYSNDHDRAMELCHRIGELEPTHFLNRLVTAQILARRGQHEQAIHEMEKINSAQQQHALTLRFWAELYAILGRRADAEQVLAKMIEKRQQGNVPASYIAAGWAALGDRDRAFEWLETAYRDYDGYLSMVSAAPAYDSLRSDKRYPALLARLGIRVGTGSDSIPPR